MKKRLIGALASVPFLAALALSGNSCAASCPYGMVNDPYPGQCGRYIDATGDGICDFSQITATSTTDASTSDASTSNDQTDPNSDVIANDQDHSTDNTTVDPVNDSDGGFFGGGDHYFVIPVSLILISGYLLTYYLFKRGVLNRNKHRRIWNLLLTAGYLGTSGTGMLLILFINLGIKTALNPSLIFWHVELAILMVISTLIHIHIHWKSFKNMFRYLFNLKSSYLKEKNSRDFS